MANKERYAMAKILLVEDEHDLAQIVLRELIAAGYETLYASNGVEALDIHVREQADLIILDWMLPLLNGLDVLRHLRKKSSTPVLMLTARSEETDRVLGLEIGADDYLTKPFSMRELIARVRALLRRNEIVQRMLNADRSDAENALVYGPLRLSPQTHIATLDDVELDLSPTEFALLQLLLRSPGRAFSRAYLIETVWSEVYIGGDRSVDNVVLRLRRKLGKLGDAIETVWGVGYRFRRETPERVY